MLGLNVSSLGKPGRELEVQHLLDDLRPEVVALSETEVPIEDTTIVFRGYTIFFPAPSPTNKYRLLLLIRKDVALQSRAVVDRVTALEIWVKLLLRSGPIMVCSIYRQWTNSEEEDIGVFHRNLREYSANFDRILVAGDLNLDWARRKDVKYYRRRMLAEHCCCLEELDLIVANELDPSPTYRSHAIFTDGKGDKAARESVLDHLLYHGLATPTFRVLPHAITDHRPILATFELPKRSGGDTFKMVTCRNFKSIDASICSVIISDKLSKVFYLNDILVRLE